MKKSPLLFALSTIIGIVLFISGIYGAAYSATPAHIRYPSIEHYHIRTQIIVDGQSIDFSEDSFQEEYVPNLCTTGISEHPFHYHDEEDQLVHVHWDGMTGGELLKFYGWNFIGGESNNLGKRFDGGFLTTQAVNIYGNVLPEVSLDTNYYVYVGDENQYSQKDWSEFLTQDLEVFFNKQSNLSSTDSTKSIWSWLLPSAYAHGGEVDNHSEGDTPSQEELTLINNLIGNVVIFAQQEEPSAEQIQTRFNNLVPLGESTCGG
jgi:hypothetical protein